MSYVPVNILPALRCVMDRTLKCLWKFLKDRDSAPTSTPTVKFYALDVAGVLIGKLLLAFLSLCARHDLVFKDLRHNALDKTVFSLQCFMRVYT